jgi:ATP-binding cassette, subfamily C, bacterial LapB
MTAHGQSPGAGEPPAGNKVHEMHARLNAVLAAWESEQIDQQSAPGACLGPLLAALDWTGQRRHLYEALPHLSKVDTIDSVRSVLSRLNYLTLMRRQNLASLSENNLPCLYEAANGELYVVISKLSARRFFVFDGQLKSFRQIDAERAGGVVYLVSVTDASDSPKRTGEAGWLQMQLVKFKRTFVALLFLTFVINCLALAPPIYSMYVYDLAIGAKSPMTLGYLFCGIAIVVAAEFTLRAVRSRYMAYLGTRIEALVTTEAFQRLLYLPLAMTESAPIGTQVTRLRQFESIRDMLNGGLANTILDLPFFLLFLITITIIGGVLGFIPIALLLLYLLMAAITTPMTKGNVKRAGEARSKRRNFLMELVGQHETIRDCGAQDVWIRRFTRLSSQAVKRQLEAQRLSMSLQTIAQAMLTIAGALTIGIGAQMVMVGSLTPGALIAVVALIWRVLSPLNAAFLSLNQLSQTTENLKQINALMKLTTEWEPGSLPTFPRKFKGRISARGVSFRYSSTAEPTLRGIDLTIEPREVVAITGPNGSGKSTLLKVLARLYQPQMGAILIDNIDLRQLNAAELRHEIAFVSQRPYVFHGTISQNLRLANPAATPDDIDRALDAAGIYEEVYRLDEGLDTRIGGGTGVKLGNEFLQMLLLARAYVRQASIYLLDEPGNNLDPAADALLLETIQKLRARATVVMITHRPSHMKIADRVVVLSKGTVVANGTPAVVLPALEQQTQPASKVAGGALPRS